MKQLRTVPKSSGNPVRIRTGDIPAHVAVNLAQTLFEVLHREFEDPEVRADYIRWKEERTKRATA